MRPEKTPSIRSLSDLIPAIFLGLALLGTFTIYTSAVNGPWVLDDQPNIVQNPDLRIRDLSFESLRRAANSMNAVDNALPGRPLSLLSFALDYYFTLPESLRGENNYGVLDDDAFRARVKLVNVLIHLLTALLLVILTGRLLSLWEVHAKDDAAPLARWIPPLVGAFWMLHPLMVSTVLYSVQRMTNLSALFVIMGVLCFLQFRSAMLERARGFLGGVITVGLFTLLAFLCKENGVLLPVLCLVIELIFFRFKKHEATPAWNHTGYTIFVCMSGVALIAGLFYLGLTGSGEQTYAHRGYTVGTRVLTEASVVLQYLSWFLYPIPESLKFLHDTQPLSVWPSWAAFGAVFSWATLALFSVMLARRNQLPWLNFALLWFVVGHSLESSVIPLELVFEHRNYLPYMGLCVGLVVSTANGLSRLPFSSFVKVSAMLLVFVVVPTTYTMKRVQHWQSEEQLLTHWQTINPESPRVWAQTAEFYYKNQKDPGTAQAALAKAFELAPWEAGYGLAQIALLCGHSKLDGEDLDRLLKNTTSALSTVPNTAYTRNQLGNVRYVCQTDMAPERLSELYEAARQVGILQN